MGGIVRVYGVAPLNLPNAHDKDLESLKVFGKCELSGTPSPDNPVQIWCNNGVIKVDNNGNVYVEGTQENIAVGNSSANAEYLLKLGDYVDSQDILNGIVNRQLGIKVFDGSEVLEIASSQPTYTRIKTLYRITNASTGNFINTICSHFFKDISAVNIVGEIAWYAGYCYFGFPPETTKEEAKNWFTQQYQNGTPVVVIYPLAEPTTEQVSPQPMSTVEGNNTLDISGSLPDLEAEVEYWEKT